MAIRFWEIYEETKEKFSLRIVAGKAGMDTVVSWVHMLEDEIIVSRFHGEELAITTGMMSQQPDWLLNVVKEMAQAESAGLIINTGMYLKDVPQEVIDWCEKHKFPLVEMPWRFSITNLIQNYCMRIMDQKQYEKRYINAFREIIQGRKDEEFLRVLEGRYNIQGTFQVFCINVKMLQEEEPNFNHAVLKLENLFGLWKGNKKINISYGLIRMEDSLALILNDMEDKYSPELPDMILQSFSYFVKKQHFHLGIGTRISRIENLSICYKRARTAMKMAIGTQKEVIRFEDMGFFRILFSVDDTAILSDYADEVLGVLEEYDKAHNAAYTDTLRSYIRNDRSIIRVAEETFTHRNTVNYRIQNIKRIIGCEFENTDEMFPFQVAFYIRDLEKKGQK